MLSVTLQEYQQAVQCCKDCKDRKVDSTTNCHVTCERHFYANELRAEYREAERKAKELNGFYHASCSYRKGTRLYNERLKTH